MTDQLNMENIQDFLVAAMNWNEEQKNVKEIARLNSQVTMITNSRVSIAKRLMTERNKFVKLVADISSLANEFKANKEVRDRLNTLIKNYTKTKPYKLSDFNITTDQMKAAEEAEKNDEQDEE